ncbi:MAG TPA: 1,4-alpha-glucan branching protein GlgB [Pirellulales bacterium]|jgi:1,4-alpha-glucan branching enzyme|nr:1,4-alpha-glucan branching protein GlgB [Pirellulales bacterium]
MSLLTQPTPHVSTTAGAVLPGTLLTADDLYWFNEGTHVRLYEKLGAHPGTLGGVAGTYFAVWAPNARSVRVDLYGNASGSHSLTPQRGSGIWAGFVEHVAPGTLYKYHIESAATFYAVDKTDPLAFFNEVPPQTASVVWPLDYTWHDDGWLAARKARIAIDAPLAVYEVHLGSWRRKPDGTWLGYREIAEPLAEYVRQMGFTHVEFLPLMEHPFYGSWGYQSTGYFAPTARYGTPQDLMYLIDYLHQQNIGVILDWVPSHFPTDAHGLNYFDGTHLYEHADPRQGFHPDWKSSVFNYERNEVRSFLLSSAVFWLDRYHADALRVDAVASMLYLDYSRKEGEWIPNAFGGRENLGAISLLRKLNETVYRLFPDVQTIAEESTAWPMVSRPTYVGGLGFGLKWDMGWMHDTLAYLARDPVIRKFHHSQLTFRQLYAFAESFQLPLSHDEVVHGKGSLLNKMPGDAWRKRANLRLLFGYQYAQPGKKLLFMGGELAEQREWNHDAGLDWQLAGEPGPAGVQRWVADLNRVYCHEPALYEYDCDARGFEWVDCCDVEQSVISFLRRGRGKDWVLVICNFTPVPRLNYLVGVPEGGRWVELLNSDADIYGGAGYGNQGSAEAAPIECFSRPWSLNLVLPPLGILFFKHGPQ